MPIGLVTIMAAVMAFRMPRLRLRPPVPMQAAGPDPWPWRRTRRRAPTGTCALTSVGITSRRQQAGEAASMARHGSSMKARDGEYDEDEVCPVG
jgi:hypothetical protein